MKNYQKFREYFINAEPEKIKSLLDKIYIAQGAAYSDHVLSRAMDAELRGILSEIVGLTNDDRERLIEKSKEYSRELASEAKDRRPYEVPVGEKKKILTNILLVIGSGAAIGAGYLFVKKKNNSALDKK
ncbi:MAG: hypothetical protein AABW81_00515 [Nanoarchaeota archaeon]